MTSVIQKLSVDIDGHKYTAEISRFPNGGGRLESVWEWDLDDSFQLKRFQRLKTLPEETIKQIEELANKAWEQYWTCDPRNGIE